MTRFARAKGSKSSNERLPNEPTPWHVMKQQLETTMDREKDQVPEKKTKTAKQLLSEKEDLYYAKSLGNVNTDWAEFEKPKNKKNAVKNGKVEKKLNDNSKKIKTTMQKMITEESSNTNETEKGQLYSKVQIEKKTTNNEKEKIESTFENKKIGAELDNKKIKKAKKKNIKEKISNDKSCILKNNSKESENKSESKTEENSGNHNQLSKRQKRNQKKQTQKHENGPDNKRINDTFNTEGNDWNHSVSSNKKRKFDNDQDRSNNIPNSNMPHRKKFDTHLEWKNFRRFGNNVPKKFQRKVAKDRDNQEHQRRKPDLDAMRLTINGVDVEIVKYDGYPIKKEDALRLAELRKEMVLKGIPKSEIDAAMKLERRKCEKTLARLRRQVCFHCRKAGHNLSDCPELGKEEAGTGICFKCGSTEHTHFECKVNKSDDYRYAKCFICKEQGHIAKQCPDNPKGMYPDGGACKICGDVTHLKKDCPDLVKEKEETTITLDTIKDDNLEVLEGEKPKVREEVKKTKKIVQF